MITTIKHKKLTWVNLESPSAEEINKLVGKHAIHPLIAEELVSLTMRPKVDIYKKNLYFVLHFPSNTIACPTCLTSAGCEIDFVISKDLLITTHYCAFPALEKFIKLAKSKEEHRKENFGKHAGFLAFNILKNIYGDTLKQLDQAYIKTNKVEDEIFADKEKEMVKKISILKRDILDFRRATFPHDTVLSSFEEQGEKFFGKDFKHYLGSLLGEHAKIKNLTENIKETLDTLHETNESLLSNKTNEVMKILTIMAFITFPLMLLSGVFGMNTVSTPIIGAKGDFWVITLIMLVATFTMFLYFKKRKWL